MTPLRQQINLYQPEAQSQRDLLGADTLLLACAAVIAAFLVIGGVGRWQVARLQRTLEALQAQQRRTEEVLGALGAASAASAASAKSSDIEARTRELQAQLAVRERALELLRDGSVGRTSGFSAKLAALARRPLTGLWLQHISLSAISNSMSLAGEVLEPELVPRYLRGLATERELSGLRFDRLEIEVKSPARAYAKSRSLSSLPGFEFRADGAASGLMRVAETHEPRP